MNPLQSMAKLLRQCLAPRRSAVPESRRRVLNLTRGTILATRLEVAGAGPTRRKGLLGRDRLAPGEGLWIVPCESVHTFFMRFPIDLVYLDRKYRVRKLRGDVGPWRLSACFFARSVLELPSGAIRQSRTQTGDTLAFSPATAADEECASGA